MTLASYKCESIFRQEETTKLDGVPDRVVFAIAGEEVVLEYASERARFYNHSRAHLAFGLSPLLPPEKSWPIKQRSLARKFFEIATDHESRARFYYSFLVKVLKELSHKGTDKEKTEYLKTRKIPERFVEDKLFELAKRHGFQIKMLEKVVGDIEFRALIKSGTLIFDDYFAGDQHGTYTHIFQVLQIAYTLDLQYGLGTTLSIYKTLGEERNFKNWFRYFDDTIGSPHSPENYNRAITKYLRF